VIGRVELHDHDRVAVPSLTQQLVAEGVELELGIGIGVARIRLVLQVEPEGAGGVAGGKGVPHPLGE
jgi:hypothetical protein